MQVCIQSFVMAPCDGSLALRLITALRLLHVLPVWTQAMPVCRSFVCLRCSVWCETNTSIDLSAKLVKLWGVLKVYLIFLPSQTYSLCICWGPPLKSSTVGACLDSSFPDIYFNYVSIYAQGDTDHIGLAYIKISTIQVIHPGIWCQIGAVPNAKIFAMGAGTDRAVRQLELIASCTKVSVWSY